MQGIPILPVLEMASQYKAGLISPVDVINAVFYRIDAFEPAVNAFTFIDQDHALKAAKASEERWRAGNPLGHLDGIPVTIKDLILTKNWPTFKGSLTTAANTIWTDDAPVTARLREAGCIIIGKTTTPEFGWKGVTDSFFSGLTCNPWNLKMTSGGSSGGAAVAAALGMGALHVGTDGGGSIRIPAGFTGTFGFKPTFGLVPAWPSSPFSSLAHIGPITRTVTDAAAMLTVITQPDYRDWQAQIPKKHTFTESIATIPKNLRIAFSPNLGYVSVDPEIATIVANAAEAFLELGAIIEIKDPGFSSPLELFNVHWNAGAAQLLHNFDKSQLRLIDPGLVKIAQEGEKISLQEYLAANHERTVFSENLNKFHQSWDLLLTPTLPIAAFPSGRAVADPSTQNHWPDWTPFTYPFNLSQQPACSVPCGFTSAGLPVGLQIIGPKYADYLVLQAAHAYESLHPFVMPKEPIDSSFSEH